VLRLHRCSKQADEAAVLRGNPDDEDGRWRAAMNSDGGEEEQEEDHEAATEVNEEQ